SRNRRAEALFQDGDDFGRGHVVGVVRWRGSGTSHKSHKTYASYGTHRRNDVTLCSASPVPCSWSGTPAPSPVPPTRPATAPIRSASGSESPAAGPWSARAWPGPCPESALALRATPPAAGGSRGHTHPPARPGPHL